MIKKGDFVELEFTGRVKEGEVFDTTSKEEAEKACLQGKDIAPLTICVGESMVPGGLDNALEGKELSKEYKVELSPKDAFGERKASLIKIIPLNIFKEKGVMPYRGLLLNLDGILVKVLSVSGGRVITDFNNPLSGKQVVYTFKIKKIIAEDKEKIDCLGKFFLRDFKIKELHKKEALIETTVPERFFSDFSARVKRLIGIEIKRAEISKTA